MSPSTNRNAMRRGVSGPQSLLRAVLAAMRWSKVCVWTDHYPTRGVRQR